MTAEEQLRGYLTPGTAAVEPDLMDGEGSIPKTPPLSLGGAECWRLAAPMGFRFLNLSRSYDWDRPVTF